MFPGIVICRHLQVEWLDSTCCRCQDCGKIGHWSNEMVIWQRPPRSAQGVSAAGPSARAESMNHGGTDELLLEKTAAKPGFAKLAS
ncbi:MAG: hypothetical protein GY768_15285 [Planctomycetaceae bacterium]|nr:hypothetical protein [Planctomycetaceae bacterium]